MAVLVKGIVLFQSGCHLEDFPLFFHALRIECMVPQRRNCLLGRITRIVRLLSCEDVNILDIDAGRLLSLDNADLLLRRHLPQV